MTRKIDVLEKKELLYMKLKVFISIIILVSFLSCLNVTGETLYNTTQTGYYLVHSNIDGAQVYFDDEQKGVITDGKLTIEVPITSTPVYSTFSVTSEGYTTYNGTILQVPLPGETISMRANLKFIPITGNGTISIGCSPPGTTVFLDNVSKGIIDYSGIMRLSEIPPGQHGLRFEKADYLTQEQYVIVESNVINQVRVELVPVPKGILQITSVPPGASVQVDNVFMGLTPLTLPGMDVRNYEVVISMAGYYDWSGTASVVPNSTYPIQAILDPVPTPPPATPVTSPPTTVPPTPQTGALPVMGITALCLISLLYLRKI